MKFKTYNNAGDYTHEYENGWKVVCLNSGDTVVIEPNGDSKTFLYKNHGGVGSREKAASYVKNNAKQWNAMSALLNSYR